MEPKKILILLKYRAANIFLNEANVIKPKEKILRKSTKNSNFKIFENIKTFFELNLLYFLVMSSKVNFNYVDRL